MDPNLPPQPATVTNVTDSGLVKKPSFLLSFLTLILGIILGTGGLLAYQQLIYKPVPQATPVATATPTPSTEPNDETAGWKEYSVKDFKLTFKAPFEMNVNVSGSTITIQDYPLNAPPPDNFFKAVISVSKTGVTNTKVDKKSQATANKILATFIFEDGCRISGCNLEICQATKAEPIASVCLWKEEYNCYKTAKCEVQTDGQCGWTQTTELRNCLAKYR